MTERTAFENPEIENATLSTPELQKILALQGEMLRKAVIRNDHEKLLDELCLLAESFTPNAVATVMLYDQHRGALFVENGPSLSPEAIEAFNGLRAGDGSCGNAVYHNEAMYVCNTLEDPRWQRIAHVAARFNICSCFSFPILNAEGNAIGSFAISSFEPRTPNGFHRALLDTCTSICGVILQRRADDQLRHQVLEEQIRAERVESLGILSGGIAHDFNNLLTTIMGNVDLTATTLPEGPAKEGLELALKAIESASELTRQLLTIAKGKNPILEPSDISRIIKDSVEFALHGSNVSYQLIGLEQLQEPVINVDGGQIGQLVQNLVINARQAMPQGGVVSINCDEVNQNDHVTLPPGDYLRLTVSDTGTGISGDVLDHVFEPYFTTRDTGNGLGLFLCYSIVKSHGGRITVDSEPGKGTCFTVYLPHSEADHQSMNESVSSAKSRNLSANVLIMDDDQLVRRTLRRILEQIGCRVWEAEHGNAALDCFTQLERDGDSIDVFVLDLTVPGAMGGIETKDELKKRNVRAKIVVSSGYSVGDACIDYQSSGFDAAIMKPYGVATVKQTLTELLES